LKASYDKYAPDFRANQSNPYGSEFGHQWRPKELIIFNSTQVLGLGETQGHYVLAARSVNLFAREQEAAEQKRIEDLQAAAKRNEKMRRDVKGQQLATLIKNRTQQCEEIASVIASREETIAGYASIVKEWQQGRESEQGGYARYTPTEVNVSKALQQEIAKLKAELAPLKAELAEAQEQLAALGSED
jgi:chromosome segregation ATPase